MKTKNTKGDDIMYIFAVLNYIDLFLDSVNWALVALSIFLSFVLFGKITKSNKNRKHSSKHSVDSKEKYAVYKGEKGEKEVANVLSQLNRKYKIINDVMIENGKGTSQIDHIVISKYGIFVIETKNYKGLLVGDELNSHVDYYCGDNKFEIYNPLRQNKSHIHTLMKALSISDESLFIPILAVSNKCEYKIATNINIAHFSELIKTIRRCKKKKLSKKEIKIIAKTIKKLNITDKKERKKHIERIQFLKNISCVNKSA